METKEIKPFGKVFTQNREYYLLEPHARAMSDGTFEILVVPYTEYNIHAYTPRFIRTTEFLLEHSNWEAITIEVSELEE
jgi:hypothetical protein